MIPSRVYLTGLMGAGKSTAGPLVAERLGYRFVDLDAAVEAVAGRSIAELFETRGEEVFRALESAVLCETAWQERVVIATGGGALATEANWLTAHESGVVVYLHAEPALLARRLVGDTSRPVLRTADGETLDEAQLRERLSDLLRRREPFYRRADAVVEVTDLSPEAVAEAVVQALTVQA